MTTVLLTGFEPFAGDPTNPSGDAVRAVAARWAGGERLVTGVLPVTFVDAAAELRALMRTHTPDIVIATGLAGGRDAVAVERVAVNLIDARIPDNAGAQPVDVPSVPDAPAARFSTLPVKAITAALMRAGIPTTLSLSAGAFVCNHVMYTALDEAGPHVRAGFVHLPWSISSGRAPALPDDQLADAVELIVRTAADTATDVSAPGGTIW